MSLTNKKTILTLGCSQSSGAEISHEKIPGYWDSILEMTDPLKEWYDPDKSPVRMQAFYEKIHTYENDYYYDLTHAWPGILSRTISEINLTSASRSGSGIDWVKFMYNLQYYYYFNTDETKQRLAKKLTNNTIAHDNLFWQLLPDHNFNRYSNILKQLYPSYRTENDNVTTNLHYIREYYSNWTDNNYCYSNKNFDILLDDADILIWQLTNEPRLNITDPSHNVICTTPSISAGVDWYLKNINSLLDKTFSDNDENSVMKQFWKNEINNVIEHYISKFDYSDHTSNILMFINSILRKRKLAGKVNILVTIDGNQLTPYHFYNRIDHSCVDKFINIREIPEMSMSDRYGTIKSRILNDTWPYMKFMHYSRYGNELIAKKITEELKEFL